MPTAAGRAADPRRRRRVDGDAGRAERRLEPVAASEIGKASGTFNMLRFLGGVFGDCRTRRRISLKRETFESPQAFSVGFASTIGTAAARYRSLLQLRACGCHAPL